MPIAPTWPAELGRSSNRKLASKPLSLNPWMGR